MISCTTLLLVVSGTRRELLIQADRLVGGSDAVLVIDDTAVPKKGKHSVGVAAQYASALGKNANCQTLVSVTLARGEVPVMVALRLFLPENWTSNPVRLKRTGVPIEYRVARTKPEIALAEIDRMISAGVRFGCVLADAGYGMSAPFRQGLTGRKLAWAVGIPRHLKVYPVGVQLVWPMTKVRGQPVSGTCLIFYRYRLKICWPVPSGELSLGAVARKAG
jgi:SRSO17 transposase